jgi:hypothetical protein
VLASIATACSVHTSTARQTPPTTPVPSRTHAAAVTVSNCRRTPPVIKRWAASHGNPSLWSLAAVQLQQESPFRRVDLVGIYIGTPRIALLVRDHDDPHASFVALDAFSHRLTGRVQNIALADLVSDRVVARLRACFPS